MKNENSDSPPRECLCDKILGGHDLRCDRSTAYVCDLHSAPERPPACYWNGREIDLVEAVSTAAQILMNAKAPLITGLGALGIRSQQAAVAVGKKVGAIVDTNGSGHSRAAAMSLPREGWITATIGEIEQRADLILVWNCDPMTTQPRLWNRLSADRDVVVFAPEHNATAKSATAFYEIAEQRTVAALMVLEAMTRQLPQTAKIVECFDWEPGFRREDAEHFLASLKRYRWIGVITEQPVGRELGEFDSEQDSLVAWIKSLQPSFKAVQLDIRSDQNSIAAENVLTWSTGFSNGVDMGGTVPLSYGCEYATERVLVRKEVDAVVCFELAGERHGEARGRWSNQTAAYLKSLPRIVFSRSPQDEASWDREGKHVPLLLLNDFQVLDDDFARLDDLLFNANELGGAVAQPSRADSRRDVGAFLRELDRAMT